MHPYYKHIKAQADDAYKQRLKNGEYPFGNCPFGFEMDLYRNLSVRDDEREFMYRAFRIFLRTQNRSETLRRLNEMRRGIGMREISYSQLSTLLENRLCIGQFVYNGEVQHEDPTIQVIDKETFWRVQEILR